MDGRCSRNAFTVAADADWAFLSPEHAEVASLVAAGVHQLPLLALVEWGAAGWAELEAVAVVTVAVRSPRRTRGRRRVAGHQPTDGAQICNGIEHGCREV